MLSNRKWLLFDRRLHPILFDEFMRLSEANHSQPDKLQTYTTSEEAFPFVLEDQFLAIVAKSSAVLLARQGVTVRPLNVENLSVKTDLISRADNDSKLASELVRAYMRKLSDVGKYRQLSSLSLPSTGSAGPWRFRFIACYPSELPLTI